MNNNPAGFLLGYLRGRNTAAFFEGVNLKITVTFLVYSRTSKT